MLLFMFHTLSCAPLSTHGLIVLTAKLFLQGASYCRVCTNSIYQVFFCSRTRACVGAVFASLGASLWWVAWT